MKTLILAAAAAAAVTLAAGAASAQPYGYVGHAYDHGAYGYNARYADRDRDGIPDRYDRYDNRRDRWEHRRHDWRYDRYERAHRW